MAKRRSTKLFSRMSWASVYPSGMGRSRQRRLRDQRKPTAPIVTVTDEQLHALALTCTINR